MDVLSSVIVVVYVAAICVDFFTGASGMHHPVQWVVFGWFLRAAVVSLLE